jgi:hypothetical protein
MDPEPTFHCHLVVGNSQDGYQQPLNKTPKGTMDNLAEIVVTFIDSCVDPGKYFAGDDGHSFQFKRLLLRLGSCARIPLSGSPWPRSTGNWEVWLLRGQ